MDPPWSVWPIILVSGVFHGLYLWGLSGAYQSGTLASTYPVARGSAPLFSAVFGVWVLDQTPNVRTLCGVMTGCFIAGYTVIDAGGAEEVGGRGFFAAVAVIGAVVVVALGRVSPRRLITARREALAVGLAANSSYGLILLAYTRGAAANVATLRATSILFGLALVPTAVTRRLAAGALLVVVSSLLVSW